MREIDRRGNALVEEALGARFESLCVRLGVSCRRGGGRNFATRRPRDGKVHLLHVLRSAGSGLLLLDGV